MTIRAHRHFDTTPAIVIPCCRCRRPQLYGLAEGFPARVDPTPIRPVDEPAFLAAGLATYTLTRTGLVYRDPSRRTDPKLAAPLLAQHRCPTRGSR